MKFYVFRTPTVSRHWYWHARRKGRIVATGGEGYVKRSQCVKMASQIAHGRPVFLIDPRTKNVLPVT